MKAIKRTVAGLLATLMFASCFSFNFAFGADNYTDDEAIAVSKVNAANIMTGTDNGFEPSKTLTRAEAAAIVVRMKGVPASQVEGAKGNTLFTDVPASSWAAGYINAASAMGIISGVGNGLFLPEREVSIVEFSAMAIRALGAGKLVDSIGTWPTNYVNFATEEKLFDGVLKAYTAPATRMDVAFMVVNTIEANMWEKTQVTNTSEVTYAKTGATILADVLKITEYPSLTVNDVDTKDREVSFTGDGSNEIANFDVVDGVELASLRSGHEVDVWVKAEDKEIIRIAPAEKAKTAKVSFSKIEKINVLDNEITLVVNGKEKTYDYKGTADTDDETLELLFSLNSLGIPTAATESVDGDGKNLLTNEASKTLEKGAFFGTAILKGNEITAIYAECYDQRGVVEEIKNNKIYFDTDIKEYDTDSTSLKMNDDEREYIVTKNGKEIDITDVEEGDALYFYEDGKRLVINVNNKSVEGTAKEISSNKYIKIDGVKYEFTFASVGALASGSEVKLYLNAADKVTMYDILDGAADSTVAIVKSLWETQPTKVGGKGNVEITLVSLDGTELDTKVVDLEESAKKLNVAGTTTKAFTDADALRAALLFDNDNVNVKRSLVVGSLVRYSVKGSNVVIREFLDVEPSTDRLVSAYEDVKVKALDGTLNYREDKAKLGSYRLNKNTEIFVVKEPTKAADKANSVKLEKVEFESLGDSDAIKGFIYDLDEDTMTIKALVIKDEDNVTRATDENYAFVLSYTAVDNGDEEDCDAEVSLVFADGKEETVYVKNDVVDFGTADLIEASIEGNKLVDAKVVREFAADEICNDCGEEEDDCECDAFIDGPEYSLVNIVKVNEAEGTVRVIVPASADEDEDEGTSDVYTIVEDCIYVQYNVDDKEYVKNDDIPTVGAVKTTEPKYEYSQKDAVKLYMVQNTETLENEVVAIIYNYEK